MSSDSVNYNTTRPDGFTIRYGRMQTEDIDGIFEEGVWTETAPAVVDEETGEEITPAVWEMIVTTRPLDVDERARWERDDEQEARKAEREAKKNELEPLRNQRDRLQDLRADMDPDTGRPKWTRDISVGAGNGAHDPANLVAADFDRLLARVDALQTEFRRLVGDTRLLTTQDIREIRGVYEAFEED